MFLTLWVSNVKDVCRNAPFGPTELRVVFGVCHPAFFLYAHSIGVEHCLIVDCDFIPGIVPE